MISSPSEPPPQVFTTADGTIQGSVNGTNKVFTLGVTLKRGRVFLNGLKQTEGIDVAVTGQVIVFLNTAPATSSLITCLGYVSP